MTVEDARVRVVPCPGASLPAGLAEEIAARLQGALPSDADPEVVAVDGCADACASRALGARGVNATSVGLNELGLASDGALAEAGREQLLDEIVRRLRAVSSARPRAARRRPPLPGQVEAGAKRTHTPDDYLYAVRVLTSPLVGCGAVVPDLPTLAAHVAHVLSVSRPSAGAMLDRLQQEGLIERGPGKEILLTQEGHRGADRIARRHRVVERMLTDMLGYPLAQCHELALQVRGEFDEAMTERLVDQLSPPERCPHGWPFDPAEEQELLDGAVVLASAGSGRATVVALVEEDAGAVERLAGLGLLPGVELDVDAVRGQLDESSSAHLLVRPL